MGNISLNEMNTYLTIGFLIAIAYDIRRKKKKSNFGFLEFVLTTVFWPLPVMDLLLDMHDGLYDLWKKEIKK